MIALSIKQPWAWLIVSGHKDIENREWATRFRGWCIVHTGKRFDMEGYEWVRQHFPEIAMPAPDVYNLGGIVGQMLIADCVSAHRSPWFAGRYGFVIHDAMPLLFRAVPGNRGFFNIDEVER